MTRAALLTVIASAVLASPQMAHGQIRTTARAQANYESYSFDIPTDQRLNHRIEVVGGVLADEVAALMRSFFEQVRNGKERVN